MGVEKIKRKIGYASSMSLMCGVEIIAIVGSSIGMSRRPFYFSSQL
jgi:hypothetical protein